MCVQLTLYFIVTRQDQDKKIKKWEKDRNKLKIVESMPSSKCCRWNKIKRINRSKRRIEIDKNWSLTPSVVNDISIKTK